MADFRVQLYDQPGGQQLSVDQGALAGGLSFSTILPGGFKDATFTLARDGLKGWADLAGGNHVEIWLGPLLVWCGRLVSPKRGSDHVWQCQALGYYFSHALDQEYTTSASSQRSPRTAITEVVNAACPLLSVNSLLLDDNGDWTIDLSQNQFQGIRPKDLFDQISKFGDATGLLWDVAVWGQGGGLLPVEYHARDRSTVTHRVGSQQGLLTIDGDSEAVRNAVRVRYQAPQTSSVQNASTTNTTLWYPTDKSYLQNDDSVARYGLKQHTIEENNITQAQAIALAQTYLAQNAWEQPRYSLVTSELSGARGGRLSDGLLATVRAGAVVTVPEIGNLFIVETAYDAAADRITLTPEFGFKRYGHDTTDQLHRLNQLLIRLTLDRMSGYSGTVSDGNVANAVHTHSTVGDPTSGNTSISGNLSVGGTSSLSGVVNAGTNLNVAGTLNANGAGGLVVANNASVGNNLTVSGTATTNSLSVNGVTLSKSGTNLSVGSGGISASSAGTTSSFYNVQANNDATVFGNVMGATVIAGQTSDPFTSDALYVNGTAHMGGLMGIATGISGTGTGVYANIYQLNASNTFQYQGTNVSFANVGGQTAITYSGASQKTAVIQEPDGTWTRFVCEEGDEARFKVRLPLSRLERCLPTWAIRRRLLARLNWRFTANTVAPYDIMRADRAAYVVAPVRADSPYQVDRPFGDPMQAPRGNEPYPPWAKPDEERR